MTEYAPNLFQALALTISLVVLILACLHNKKSRRKIADAMYQASTVNRRIHELEESIQDLQALMNDCEAANQEPNYVPEPPKPKSPAENRRDELLDRIEAFEQLLNAWERAAGGKTSIVANYGKKSQEPEGVLRGAVDMRQIDSAEKDLSKLQSETLYLALSNSDKQIDTRRNNDSLQKAINGMVELCDLTFIDPARGARLDNLQHAMAGTDDADPRYQRNSIAFVQIRGLKYADNEVLKPARVFVYS